MNKYWLFVVLSLFVLALSCSNFGTSDIDFNTQIRPLINEKCMNCHGGVRANGDLSFLFEQTALLPAKSGKKAIIPFKPNLSELIHRIKHEDPELRMPLDADPLSLDEINLLEKWINQGAKWGTHWAYISPDENISPPKIEGDWGYNGIDPFIFKKMKSENLTPSKLASNSNLIRRASLDIIGLPPNDVMVQQFLSSSEKNSYEIIVDELLDSEHFGEKWASMWLDLARYADSRGYQKDILRPEIWRYRDWVIKAFNDDMPFDQFTIEQLAGDLIVDRSDDQLLATAFHRNTMTNDEGGTKNEEFRLAAVMDRLSTTMEIWQGNTMACVQCHSHPYDPIKHEEFYGMMAFFNNTMDNDNDNDYPKASLLSPNERLMKSILESRLSNFKSNGDSISEDYQIALNEFISIQPNSVPIILELPIDSSRKTVVFEKGNWLVHGEEVSPSIPSFLPEMAQNFPKNRLGLAQWLVSEENPLTARVVVNRIWEQIFGRGIVTTVEDFGTQSESPTHPELLDWLALRFINEHQWSIKSLIKEIMMSKTYQLSSNVSDEQLALDPYNRYLSRGSRYRLSAEQIRDQALAISGLLSNKVYGKSVMPPQPDGVWNVIRHVAKWEKSEGDDSHRRGIYTFWRRVSPYPSMISFDVPSREFCVSKRIRTNTPLQALITLNDPVFVEASEALAHLMINKGGESPEDQISFGFQKALMRLPGQSSLNHLSELYHQQLEQNSSRMNAMKEVASVILNLDELIMRT
tara:strand:+ start:58 stop:2304 length:2247 start_codon:yes stop_codon:yes gene_type:complete